MPEILGIMHYRRYTYTIDDWWLLILTLITHYHFRGYFYLLRYRTRSQCQQTRTKLFMRVVRLIGDRYECSVTCSGTLSYNRSEFLSAAAQLSFVRRVYLHPLTAIIIRNASTTKTTKDITLINCNSSKCKLYNNCPHITTRDFKVWYK